MSTLRRIKVLLASRKLFRNWFLVGIRYYLTKLGLIHSINIKVICKDGSRSIISMRAYGGLVNDYYDGYITNYDCKEGIATYMNKAHVPIKELEKSSDIGFAVENGWAYDLANKYWTKSNVRFRHMHWPILEVFDFGNYEGIDVNGKVVIDVGAFVGDTAIYFLLKGAKKVIAIEPLPANYEELLYNIHLNNMEGRIIPINAMVSNRHMIVEVPTNVPIDIRGGSINEFKRHGAGDYVNIESITLSDVINKFKVNPANAVLKLDCEGCEYDIILNDYEHVKLFKEVIFEYHAYVTNRSVTELISAINKDFSCQLMNKEFYKKYFNNYTKDQLGLMRCVRNR